MKIKIHILVVLLVLHLKNCKSLRIFLSNDGGVHSSLSRLSDGISLKHATKPTMGQARLLIMITTKYLNIEYSSQANGKIISALWGFEGEFKMKEFSLTFIQIKVIL